MGCAPVVMLAVRWLGQGKGRGCMQVVRFAVRVHRGGSSVVPQSLMKRPWKMAPASSAAP